MVTVSTSITTDGYVADARAVNSLQTQINSLNINSSVINKIIFKHTSVSFSYTYTEKHTAVDVNKSFILISNRASNGTYDIPIRISSRTTNSFTIKGSLSGYTLEFSYQIIEFR